MKSDRLSLRQRLLLWLLPPLLLLTGLWTWAAYAIVLHFANLAYDRALEDTVHTLAEQVYVEPGRIEVNLPPAARRMLEFDQVDKVYFSVADHLGRQVVGNHALPSGGPGDGSGDETHFYDDRVEGEAVRLVERRLPSDSAGGTLYVRVAETLHKREILAREALIYMIAPQFMFLAGIVLLVWYGIGRGIAPLSRIRDAISRRTHEDLSPLDETGLPAEVHEQVHVINDMMFRLGKTITAQRRFIADATHQLRTPITVLRTQTELALRVGEPDQLRALVTKLDSATARLARLANQLLNLSRAEAVPEGALDFARIEVAEMVEDVVAGLVPAALDKQIDISVDIADSLPAVRGDRQLLSEMLANLVDNAIRYTLDGGRIDVDVRSADGRVVFAVSDNGPGIPEQERQRVLERFYRGADAGAEGSGLGLAIAHEIISLHGGTIALGQAPGDTGLRVTVEIPVAFSPSSPTPTGKLGSVL